MIHIPSNASINALLKQGWMVKAGPDTLFTTDKSHCVVLLNKNPRDDDYLVFVSATSQWQKRIEHAERVGLPVSTIVMIRPNSYHHLPQYTAVDCNNVYPITSGVLATLHSEGRISFYTMHPEVNDGHLTELIQGVKDSPLVQNEVKNII